MHPHIVRILEFGIEQEQQQAYLIMDYAPNGTLRQRHASCDGNQRPAAVPLPTVVEYVQQITSALQYAHEMRCVHRDLKPDNILVDRNNRLLVSDFGLARTYRSTMKSLGVLQSDHISGTLPYMAPEQFAGQTQFATDQYALGVMVYEWLTGFYPFNGNFWEIISQHIELSEPPSLLRLNPVIPASVEQVVFKALHKDPRNRFVDMLSFAQALKHAANDQSFEVQAQPYAIGGDSFSMHNDRQVLLSLAPNEKPLPAVDVSLVSTTELTSQSTPQQAPQSDHGFPYGQMPFPVLLFGDNLPVSTVEPIPLNDVMTTPQSHDPVAVSTQRQGVNGEPLPFVTPNLVGPRRSQRYSAPTLIAVLVAILLIMGTGSAIVFLHPFSVGAQQQVVVAESPTAMATITATPATKKATATAAATATPTPAIQPTTPQAPVIQPTVPPVTPTPTVTSTSYEAESPLNTRGSNLQEFSCPFCSGGERIGWIEGSDTLQFNDVTAAYSGSYALQIYYYNSVPNRVTELYFSVNDGANVQVPGLQVATENCCNYAPQVVSTTVALQAGQNTITLSNPDRPAPDKTVLLSRHSCLYRGYDDGVSWCVDEGAAA